VGLFIELIRVIEVLFDKKDEMIRRLLPEELESQNAA